MPGEDDPAAPMKKTNILPFNAPVFDWNTSNLYTQFRIFKTKVDFTFDGTYKNNPKDAKVGAILNLMGDLAFEIYNNFVWTNPDDKKDHTKVLKQFEDYFKPSQNIYHSWYMLGGLYSSQY